VNAHTTRRQTEEPVTTLTHKVFDGKLQGAIEGKLRCFADKFAHHQLTIITSRGRQLLVCTKQFYSQRARQQDEKDNRNTEQRVRTQELNRTKIENRENLPVAHSSGETLFFSASSTRLGTTLESSFFTGSGSVT
jgi:hypothetical protein